MNKIFLFIFNITVLFSNNKANSHKIVTEIFLTDEEKIYDSMLKEDFNENLLPINETKKNNTFFWEDIKSKKNMLYCNSQKNPPILFEFLLDFLLCYFSTFFLNDFFIQKSQYNKKVDLKLLYITYLFFLFILGYFFFFAKKDTIINWFFCLFYNFFYAGFFIYFQENFGENKQINKIDLTWYLVYNILINLFLHTRMFFNKIHHNSLGWIFLLTNIISMIFSGIYIALYYKNFINFFFTNKKIEFEKSFSAFFFVAVITFNFIFFIFLSLLERITKSRYKAKINVNQSLKNNFLLKSLLIIRCVFFLFLFLLFFLEKENFVLEKVTIFAETYLEDFVFYKNANYSAFSFLSGYEQNLSLPKIPETECVKISIVNTIICIIFLSPILG